MTEISFHTEERDGVQLFFVSESLGEKSHTHTGVMRTHVMNTHTHLHTYLSDRTWLLTYFPIYPKETSSGFFLWSSSSLFPDFPLSFLSPPLPLSLQSSVNAFTHRHTDPDTHTPLSRCLSCHLPPSLSPLTHTCTRSEWRLANFYTAGNCSATPPLSFPSLSLPPCITLKVSPPH